MLASTVADENGRFSVVATVPPIESDEAFSFYVMAFPMNWTRTAENVRLAPKDVFIVASHYHLPATGTGLTADKGMDARVVVVALFSIISGIYAVLLSRSRRMSEPRQ